MATFFRTSPIFILCMGMVIIARPLSIFILYLGCVCLQSTDPYKSLICV
jgi:hypothetical protein